MQSVLYCDMEGVSRILEQLQSASPDVQQSIIANARVDGNRNVFHAAVMNSFAVTNRDQADIDPESRSLDTSEADRARDRYDRKWHEMLTSSSPSKGIEKRSAKVEGK